MLDLTKLFSPGRKAVSETPVAAPVAEEKIILPANARVAIPSITANLARRPHPAWGLSYLPEGETDASESGPEVKQGQSQSGRLKSYFVR